MTKSRNKKTTHYRFKGVEWIFMNLPFVCYLALLGALYIFNAHGVEKDLRKIEVLKTEVNDARWRYMNVKQEVMYGSTQSQIQEKVAELNLQPISEVPYVISDDN